MTRLVGVSGKQALRTSHLRALWVASLRRPLCGGCQGGDGQRHRDEGAQTWFLWDGDAMAGEVRRTGLHPSEARFYVYRQGGFEPLAMQVDDGACKRIYFYQNDPHGAPVRLSRAGGDIVWETHQSVTGAVEWCETRQIEQAIRLQGQYYDQESNLHYNRYRYYDPGAGSFISQDPIGLAGGLNQYQYAANVFGWIDPLGLSHDKARKKNGANTDEGSLHANNVRKLATEGGDEPTTRVRHYTNRAGSNGIEGSGVIRARDNNRVYVQPAKDKPLSTIEAEKQYQIGRGRGRDYVETDVPNSQLEWVSNPRYNTLELTARGDVTLSDSATITRRK